MFDGDTNVRLGVDGQMLATTHTHTHRVIAKRGDVCGFGQKVLLIEVSKRSDEVTE